MFIRLLVRPGAPPPDDHPPPGQAEGVSRPPTGEAITWPAAGAWEEFERSPSPAAGVVACARTPPAGPGRGTTGGVLRRQSPPRRGCSSCYL